MLSDEEKKAIEVLQYVKNKTPFIFWYEDKPYNRKETINTILNLIEKQSKEIEELKEDLKKKPIFLIKDIYSPKLKEINLQDAEGLIEQGREEVRDKIKAKIEEIKQRREKDGECELALYGFQREAKIEVLQSLLEKE